MSIGSNFVNAALGKPSNINETEVQVPLRPPASTTAVSQASSPGHIPLSSNILVNPMNQYASFNAVWTMSCLSTDEFNNPSSYRRGQLSDIIFSSAGRFDSKRIQTTRGAPEFFVDNFKIYSAIAANTKIGNAYGFKYEFEIFEPYSMGLFLESMQIAAAKKQYVNYLQAPFLLKLEFKGWDGDGKEIVDGVPAKYFVVKITSAKFKVSSSGSTYDIEAVPYNHTLYSDSEIKITNDIILDTREQEKVKEILAGEKNSLKKALNDIEEERFNSHKCKIKTVYDIKFPEHLKTPPTITPKPSPKTNFTPGIDQSKEVPVSQAQAGSESTGENQIGEAEFDFTEALGGLYTFGDDDQKYSKVEGDYTDKIDLEIKPKERTFIFSQGQSVLKIINEVIKNSKYIPTQLKDSKEGFIPYYKINVNVKLFKHDAQRGEPSKHIIYEIVPFTVHEKTFNNIASNPQGYATIKREISKEYNYIYTGQNIDVLDFDINIDNLVFVGFNPTNDNRTGTEKNPDVHGTATNLVSTETANLGPQPQVTTNPLGGTPVKGDTNSPGKELTGIGITTIEQQVAQNFHNNFINGVSADLVKLNLKILGDPYWISDSGLVNYTSAPPYPTHVTPDGAMNYEAGDIFIYVKFRTPSDVGEQGGLYKFAGGKESEFTGIYRVTKVISEFNGGVFTQTLETVRMIGQKEESIPPTGDSLLIIPTDTTVHEKDQTANTYPAPT